ncbi:MAG: hypothetical protein ACHBNF_16910 [Chromatiales bacterium]
MGADYQVQWFTSGTEADVETDSPAFGFVWPLPGPGGTENLGGDGVIIYDALVFNACGSFSSYPVKHSSHIGDPTDTGLGESGSFVGHDDSTIDSTGFYNLNYTVRAGGSNPASDFHFSGKVSVTCSGLNALPEQ